jgi:PAS domain S-box-containing protein
VHSFTSEVPPTALLDAAFEHAGVALCLVAPDGTILRANAEWLRCAGMHREAAIGSDLLDLFPEVRPLAAALHARARAGQVVDVPRHVTRVRGREVWCEGRIAPVPVEGGVALLVTTLDVTEQVLQQREAEAALLEREAFLRRVIDTAPSMVFVKDREGRFVLANEAVARCYGTTTSGLIGKTDADFNPSAENVAAFRRDDLAVMDSLRTQRITEEPVRHATGEVRWYDTVKAPLVRDDGGCDEVLGIATDITDQKSAQEHLHETEQRFRFLADAMPQIVCVLAVDGTPEYVSPSWTEYSGLPLEATREVGWLGVLHPDDVAAAADCRRRILKGLAPQEVELRYRRADGTFRWFLSRIAPSVERGRVVRFVGAAMDIDDRKRAMEALRKSEERFQLVNRATHEVVWDWDLTDDVVVWNDALRESFGYGADDVVNDVAWWFERVHPDDRDAVASTRDAVLEDATQPSWSAEYRFRHASGRWLHVLDRGYVARDEAGRAVRMIGSMLEVTERKLAEEALRRSEEQLRSLADTMPQLVWTNRPDGTAEFYNRNWREYTGTSVEDTPGDSWARVLHPDDLARTMERWHHSLATGAPYEIEYRLRSAADGVYRWFLARALPVRDHGRIVRWLGTCTDIDERKRVEAELQNADRAVRASEQLLREEHRRKDEFLGMLSHELRNPLAPIRNSIYLLRHAGAARADSALQVMERQTAHLTRLVDDLLDVTRIARGKVQLRRERLDVREVVRRTGEDFRFALEDRGVALHVVTPDERLWVEADATRLAQVLGNLLHNAAKFTRRGDAVTVSVAREGDDVELRVRDTGAGIDPALLSGIFEPFVQSDRTLARTEGGLGLGLALVKGIVELHGGRVSAASEGIGTGSEFTVAFQASAPPGSAAVAAPALHRGGRRHVLVVDDNRDAAESMAQLVGVLGHEAEVAYDAESAVERARVGRPDTIFCDIGLPGTDGYEVARQIRAFSPRNLRLVAVSGYAQPEDVARALEAGFDAHVAKPADPARIEELLG